MPPSLLLLLLLLSSSFVLVRSDKMDKKNKEERATKSEVFRLKKFYQSKESLV
jgi:hypothetical protein